MRQTVLSAGGAVWALVLVGCASQSRGSATMTAALARRDIVLLERRLRVNNIARPQLVLEAYLAHFSGRFPTRDRALCAWFSNSGLTAISARDRLGLVQPPSTSRMRHFLAAVRLQRPCAPMKRSLPSDSILPGVYAFTETKNSLSGDTLLVRERWLMRRNGSRIWGWYLRRLERHSGDGRPYQCNRAPRYSVLMAFMFEGKVSEGKLALVETDAFIRPGPCAPKRVRLDICSGAAFAQQLVLKCPRTIRLRRVSPSSGRPGVATGVFRWNRALPRPDGSRHWIEMDLHLDQKNGRILGWMSRATSATARKGKSFACNGRRRYGLNQMFVVTGSIKNGSIALRELVSLHRPGPCDNGKVKLRTYSGSLAGNALRLRWRSGAGTFKRRPGVTTPTLSLGPMKHRWFER